MARLRRHSIDLESDGGTHDFSANFHIIRVKIVWPKPQNDGAKRGQIEFRIYILT